MASFNFLTKYRQHNYKKEEASPQLDADSKYDPITDNDLSYEDALLDLSVRLYMQEEFGNAEPPSGVFKRVMRAVEAHLRTSARIQPQVQALTPALKNLLATFRRALNGQVASRLLPGGVALALTLSIGLASNMGRISRIEISPSQQPSTAAQSAQTIHVAIERRTIPATTEAEASSPTLQGLYGTYDVSGYDPYELRTAAKNSDRGQSDKEYQEYPDSTTKHERTQFIPEQGALVPN